jgi:hypothetical protein
MNPKTNTAMLSVTGMPSNPGTQSQQGKQNAYNAAYQPGSQFAAVMPGVANIPAWHPAVNGTVLLDGTVNNHALYSGAVNTPGSNVYWGGGSGTGSGSGTPSPTGGSGTGASTGAGTGASGGKSTANNFGATNFLQAPSQNLINVASGMANAWNAQLPGVGSVFNQMFQSQPTSIEQNLLNQASQSAMNQLGSKYEDMPGHSGMVQEMGDYIGQQAAQLAQARQQYILPGMQMATQGLMSSAQVPYNVGMQNVSAGSNYSLGPMQALTGGLAQVPYNPPVYQTGGGGGGKK